MLRWKYWNVLILKRIPICSTLGTHVDGTGGNDKPGKVSLPNLYLGTHNLVMLFQNFGYFVSDISQIFKYFSCGQMALFWLKKRWYLSGGVPSVTSSTVTRLIPGSSISSPAGLYCANTNWMPVFTPAALRVALPEKILFNRSIVSAILAADKLP